MLPLHYSLLTTHYSLLDELLRRRIDRPVAFAARGVDVKIGAGGARPVGRGGDPVAGVARMIGQQELRIIDAVELPQHPDEVGLAAQRQPERNPGYAAER